MKKILLFLMMPFLSFGVFAQDIIMQDGTFNQCTGSFFDPGGPNSNYTPGGTIITTICPDSGTGTLTIDFSAFSLQPGFGTLTIYDGADTSAPVIGSYQGTNSPGEITPSDTNVSSCLTFEFSSFGSLGASGWEASINCLVECQDIVASIDSTDPPADGSGVIEVEIGQNIDFFGSATFSESGAGASYNWIFGDGGAMSGTEVNHAYSFAGTYTVTFTVSDPNPTGCFNQDTITVNVLQGYVSVDADQYTDEELISDILLGGACAGMDNLVTQTGTNFGDVDGIGYFERSGANFPFEYGIILQSGDCEQAEGPESGIISTGNWQGDADLEALMPWVDPGTTNDATYMEFDFVPLTDFISFNYIFAAEEYGTYQCGFSDAFAFLLTDMTTGVTTNLAVIPGTTEPVSVFTVRDQAYNSSCESVNPEYFAAYFGTGGFPTDNAPIDFKGHTVPLTASSAVTPNNLYKIKLVVADDNDHAYDSAVFIEGGSFDLGGDLGPDITIANQNTTCEGNSITLNTNIFIGDGNHVWYKDGVEIAGEASSSLVVSESGTYSFSLDLNGSCDATDSIIVEFYPNPEVQDISNLFICDSEPQPYLFDLTVNDAIITGTQDNAADFVVTYHISQEDADDDEGLITNPEAYPGANGEIIYARIDFPFSDCYEVATFELTVGDGLPLGAPQTLQGCDDDNGSASFNLTFNEEDILAGYTGMTVTYYTSQADADAGSNPIANPDDYTSTGETVYVRVEDTSGTTSDCFGTTSFDLEVIPGLELGQANDLSDCASSDGTTIVDLTQNEADIIQGISDVTVSYFTSQEDAENNANAISDPTSYETAGETVYVLVEGNTTSCTAITTFETFADEVPEVSFDRDYQICATAISPVTVTADADNFSEDEVIITWFKGTVEIPGENELSLPVSQAGTYTVQVEFIDSGCVSSADVLVEQVENCIIPQVITPNNDGFNDNFDLSGLNVTEINIYNRYGTLVYSKSDYTNEWFGQSDGGDELPVGTYFFTMNYGNNEVYTSWVYVNR